VGLLPASITSAHGIVRDLGTVDSDELPVQLVSRPRERRIVVVRASELRDGCAQCGDPRLWGRPQRAADRPREPDTSLARRFSDLSGGTSLRCEVVGPGSSSPFWED